MGGGTGWNSIAFTTRVFSLSMGSDGGAGGTGTVQGTSDSSVYNINTSPQPVWTSRCSIEGRKIN